MDEEETGNIQEQYEDLPALPEPPTSTVIAAGTTMSGTLQGEGIIQVEGTVDGEIGQAGAVIITPTGLVKGPVTADVVRVAGRIEGVVTARERLLLQKTGSIEGDITTPTLEVEDGGRLNGRSTMPPRPQPRTPQPEADQN
ncbi:MAG: polymer-forming cytoskeletal protein [Oscillibacter sp.]|nr:polymer-forming cytoskeletal protein [Oscillibacter sp.]